MKLLNRAASWGLLSMICLTLLLGLAFAGCSAETSGRLKVVASTSLLGSIVERIGGDRVEVVNIIPSAQCPGHFDVKPGDIRKLADAAVFLMHGWQGEKFSQELIASANNPGLAVVKVNAPGNWMTPAVQAAAIDELAAVLGRADPASSGAYQKQAAELKTMVAARGAEAKARLDKAAISGISVLCAEQLAGFASWAGFRVIATYGEPDTLTPQLVRDLVDKGRQAKAALIIDNLQSGENAGAGIAAELGIKRVVLSNFPGGFGGTETWEKALDRNVQILLEAVAR